MDDRYALTPVTEQDRAEFGKHLLGFESSGISNDLRERWRDERWRAFAKMMEELPSAERERWLALWAAGEVEQDDCGGFSRPRGSLHRHHVLIEYDHEADGPQFGSIDPDVQALAYLQGRPVAFIDERA